AAAPTSPTRPTTRASSRSPKSAPGRSGASPSWAAAKPTRSPPETSATSSWSATSPGSAGAPPSPRSRSSTPPMSPTAAWSARSPSPASTGPSPAVRRYGWPPDPWGDRPRRIDAENLSFEPSGQVAGSGVDKDTMPESGEHNWPGDEFGSFLDRLGAGDEESGRLIDRLPVIIYASELGENGRWRYVSPQVEEILGFTPEEFL